MARLQAKPVTANEPMTAAQAATLKAAYELDAFKPNLTRAEAGKTHYHANGQAQAA